MKKKRTKKYQPKPINIHSAQLAIKLTKAIDVKAQNRLEQNARSALLAFTRGVGEPRHYEDLALISDVSLLMANRYFGGAYLAEINEAQGALLRARGRYESEGKFGLDGVGMNYLKTLLAIYCEQLNNVTGKEYMNMIEARKKLVARGSVYKSEQDRLQKIGMAA